MSLIIHPKDHRLDCVGVQESVLLRHTVTESQIYFLTRKSVKRIFNYIYIIKTISLSISPHSQQLWLCDCDVPLLPNPHRLHDSCTSPIGFGKSTSRTEKQENISRKTWLRVSEVVSLQCCSGRQKLIYSLSSRRPKGGRISRTYTWMTTRFFVATLLWMTLV